METTVAATGRAERAKAGGQKSLNVLVPETAHFQARKAALESRMSFKQYMALLMLAAKPILPEQRQGPSKI